MSDRDERIVVIEHEGQHGTMPDYWAEPLAKLLAVIDEAEEYQRRKRDALAADLAAALERAETAERELDEARQESLWHGRWDKEARLHHGTRQLLARVRAENDTLREALMWYAERRNYVPAGPPAVAAPEHLMVTDSFDDCGPGARARAALAVVPVGENTRHDTETTGGDDATA